MTPLIGRHSYTIPRIHELSRMRCMGWVLYTVVPCFSRVVWHACTQAFTILRDMVLETCCLPMSLQRRMPSCATRSGHMMRCHRDLQCLGVRFRHEAQWCPCAPRCRETSDHQKRPSDIARMLVQ